VVFVEQHPHACTRFRWSWANSINRLILRDGEHWKALVQFFDGLPKVKAADNGVGQDAGTDDDRLAGDFTGDLFDQFADCPIDCCIGIESCRGFALVFIVILSAA
jgi:hypothetical protein